MIFNLTRKGINIKAGDLTPQEFVKLRKSLTVTNIGFGDRMQTMKSYQIDTKEKILYAARIKGTEILNKMGHTINNIIPHGENIKITSNFDLKDFQIPIYDHLINNIYSGINSCILDLKPGKGKTYLAMSLIKHFGKKTLFVVPGKELITQTTKLLKQIFPELIIGEYYSVKKTDGDIVVMTTKSAALLHKYTFTQNNKKITLNKDEYFDRFGLTIFDEIHTYCTSEQQEIFYKAGSFRTFGISGTCFDRTDGMDQIAHMHIGTPISAADLMPKDEIIEWKFDAYCLRYNGPPDFTKPLISSADFISCPMMVTQFSKDPYRSQWLVDIIKQLVDDNHQVFVMLDRTELVKLAYEYLKTVFTKDGELEAASMVTGKVNDQLRSVARKSKVVIGTYGCIGTGISWDEFTGIVFWHPRRNNYKQFLNRIFRENGDRTKTRVAYYLQDNSTSIKTQYTGFKKICKEERNIDPIVISKSYTEITVSPEIKEISENFIKWEQK